MCDPICLQHGSKNKHNTYARGSKRIDCVFCASNISQFIIRSGILPFYSITTTDHRALYIDIKLKEDLRDSHQLKKAPKTKRIQSRFTKSFLAYKKDLFKYVEEQQIMKSIDIIKINSTRKLLT